MAFKNLSQFGNLWTEFVFFFSWRILFMMGKNKNYVWLASIHMQPENSN